MAEKRCPFCDSADTEERHTGSWQCNACCRWFRPVAVKARSTSRTTRGRAARQEEFNARQVKGRVTSNSGAGPDKGDIKVRGLLREEDKTTGKTSYVLRLQDLRKVSAAARGDEIPIMRIAFEDDLRQQYVVMPSAWFQQLLEVFREHG